jgi:hypothetical protein
LEDGAEDSEDNDDSDDSDSDDSDDSDDSEIFVCLHSGKPANGRGLFAKPCSLDTKDWS